MQKPKVSVVILHLKDINGLLDCLMSLQGVLYPRFDVVLVHNGAANPVLGEKILPFTAMMAKVIHTGENLGFALGTNIGIKYALDNGADYVFLLNDDTVCSTDLLDNLVSEAEKDSLSGLLGPEVLYSGDRQRISFVGAKFDQVACTFSFPHADELSVPSGISAPVESDYITGCALLAKKSLLEKIGLLDERFFLYWEDSDWGLRAKKAGFRCLVVPAAKIWHKVSASSGGGDSPLKAYHKTRSHLLFADIHAPAAKKKILLKVARDIAWLIFKSGAPGTSRLAAAYIAAVLDYSRGCSGAGPAWLTNK